MKKTDLKLIAFSAAGVVIAGFLMAQFANVGVIAQAKSGYN